MGDAVESTRIDVAPLGHEITFVTWKWQGTDPHRTFLSAHVNVLRAMLARHYHAPHRLLCITDDARGLDPCIEVLPLPLTKADALTSPHSTLSKVFPACYRRLWLFSEEAATLLPGRIGLLDIDVVILSDITALLQSKTADFVGWCCPEFGWSKVAGGFWMHTPGTRTDVWETFDPARSPALAYAQGLRGSDQSWLSYMLYPCKETITARDGVVKIGWLRKSGHVPPHGTKMIFLSGVAPPWDPAVQRGQSWITEHWRL